LQRAVAYNKQSLAGDFLRDRSKHQAAQGGGFRVFGIASELASARTSGNGLKQRIASAQQNLRSIITKLKAANQWEGLEAKLNALIPAGELRSTLQSEGRAKKIWEDLANNLGPLSQEIDGDVQKLSGKVQSRSNFTEAESRISILNVSYQPAPAFAKGLRCRLLIAGLTIKLFVGSRPPTSPEDAAGRDACGNVNSTI